MSLTPTLKETLNPYEIVQGQIEKAASMLNLPRSVVEILKRPKRVLAVNFPVKMDDGSVRVFEGYRAQHTDAIGPAKGGIRFHPAVTAAELEELALRMTLKCSLLGLPYGGAKGGVACDASKLSQRELEQVSA